MPELLQQFLTRSAERFGDATALVYNEERVAYGQLEQSTNQVARFLRACGCNQGDRVCFLIPKWPLAVTCMLGILKADCLHVPLDTASPAARLAKILRSCHPRVLFAAGPVEQVLEELSAAGELADISVAWLDAQRRLPEIIAATFSSADIAAHSSEAVPYKNCPQSPSHILFTSGSTGVPKGVVITHANVIHFVEWATKYFPIQSSDRVSGHSPLHFDLSQFDIFGALAAGAEMHMVPPDCNLLPNKAAAFIRDSGLTQWFSVPSALHYMAKFSVFGHGDFPLLKRVIWCGEALATPVLIRWMSRLPHVSFTNLYGPTETTIASSYYTVPACPGDPQASIPIGVPCDGEEFLVLDSEMKRVRDGDIGRLYIRGAGVARGYWEDEERTRAVFLDDPFAGPPNRLYDTGDLATVGAGGLFYFLGRVDSQIKSRGYRIELGEIEAALNTIEFIRECAVVAVPSAGFEGSAICCAYSTDDAGVGNPAAVRTRLSRLLPTYMVPFHWIVLHTLPKNSNGKIDRPKLREQFRTMVMENAGSETVSVA